MCRPRGQLGGGCSPARPTRHAARAALRGTRVTRRAPAALSPSGPGRVSRSDGGQTRPVCSAEDLGRAPDPAGSRATPGPRAAHVLGSPGHRPCPGPPPGRRPWGQPWSSPPAGLQRGAGGADRQGGPRARRHPPWSRRPGSLSPTRGSYGRHPPTPQRPVRRTLRPASVTVPFTKQWGGGNVPDASSSGSRAADSPRRPPAAHARHAPTRGERAHTAPAPSAPAARAQGTSSALVTGTRPAREAGAVNKAGGTCVLPGRGQALWPGGGVRGAAEHGELSRCRGAAPRPGGHRLATTAQTAVTRLPRVTLARGLGVGPGTTSEATIMPWPQPHAGLAERTVPSTCSCVRVNGSQVRDGQVGVRRRDSLRSGHWQLNLCPPEVTGCLFTRPEHSFITWRPEEGPASRPRSPQDRPRVLTAPDRSTAAGGSWAETVCGATAPPPGRAAARRTQDSPGRSPPGLRQKTEGRAPGRGGGRRALSPTRGHRRPGRAAQCPLQAALASAVGLQPFTVNTDNLRLLRRSRTSFAGRVFVDRLSPDS